MVSLLSAEALDEHPIVFPFDLDGVVSATNSTTEFDDSTFLHFHVHLDGIDKQNLRQNLCNFKTLTQSYFLVI